MVSITRPKRDVPGLRGATLNHLEHLAVELCRRGLRASLAAPPGRIPRLEVCHPAGPSEDVYAWRGQDGTWWFWWSWAERIACAADIGATVTRIEQLLSKRSWS